MSDTSTYTQAFEQAQKLLLQGQFDLALEQADAILEVHRQDAKTHFLRAIALRNLGRHTEAVERLEALAKGTRNVAAIHFELGLTRYALKRIDDSIDALREAVRINPKLGPAWQLLGECLQGEDEVDEAEQAFRNAMASTHMHPGIIKALDLVREEKFGMAEGICRDYLQRNPTDVTVIRLLAEIGIKLGVKRDPEILLEDCLRLAPDYHLARNTYASALGQANKYEQALKEIDYLERVEPQNLSHKVLAASIEVMVGNYEQAAQRYGQLVRDIPNYAQLHNSYGHALKTLGRQKEAIAEYRTAIDLRETMGDAYWNLANLKTFTFSEDDISRMRRVIDKGTERRSDQYHLCFALGKALEDAGEYDESFRYYEEGNKLKCEGEGYQADETTAETNRLISTCDGRLFKDAENAGHPAADPIFIVGLPRSGSTLLEQILASHSMVDGTSELREMVAIARRIGGKRNKSDESQYPGYLLKMSATERNELGAEYIERTRIQRGEAPFFIDKMPNNFQHVALIKLILPNAKIIDARRHPMSTCFSGYKQLFAAGQTFTYSQTDIARYYSDYVRLMDHWQKVLPGSVLKVVYEHVIADTEGQIRRLLDYCGLPFEEQCLAFHQTKRAIRTASSEQVRQPIYTSALDQWQHFDTHLSPMKTVLLKLIETHESRL